MQRSHGGYDKIILNREHIVPMIKVLVQVLASSYSTSISLLRTLETMESTFYSAKTKHKIVAKGSVTIFDGRSESIYYGDTITIEVTDGKVEVHQE
jgi:hypothetical protein